MVYFYGETDLPKISLIGMVVMSCGVKDPSWIKKTGFIFILLNIVSGVTDISNSPVSPDSIMKSCVRLPSSDKKIGLHSFTFDCLL